MEPWVKGLERLGKIRGRERMGGSVDKRVGEIKGLERLGKIGGREGMGGSVDKRLGETG